MALDRVMVIHFAPDHLRLLLISSDLQCFVREHASHLKSSQGQSRDVADRQEHTGTKTSRPHNTFV
jgi:hypothetical protein